MKAVIQRVTSASVNVDQRQVSKIGRGLCVLVGVALNDSKEDIHYLVNKILSLKLFSTQTDQEQIQHQPSNESTIDQSLQPKIKQWSQNIRDINGEILMVSQFTLLAKTKKGNKPDFHNALEPQLSREIYQDLLSSLQSNYRKDLVKQGEFGSMMQVNISNDGPVTIVLDTHEK